MSRKSLFPQIRAPYGTDIEERSSWSDGGYRYQYNPERLYNQASNHQIEGQYMRPNYGAVLSDRVYIDDIIKKEIHWLSNTLDTALKKIDDDVLKLCGEMKLRDKTISDLTLGLNTMEKHYTTAVEDLTSKMLAYDNRSQQIRSEIKFCQADLDKICQLHVKEKEKLIGDIYKTKTENVSESSKVRTEMEELKMSWNKDMSQLEERLKMEVDEIRNKSSAIEGYMKTSLTAMKKALETAYNSMDAKFTQLINDESKMLKESLETQKKMFKVDISSLEEKIQDLKTNTAENMILIEKRMKTLEESIEYEKKLQGEFRLDMEMKIKTLYDRDLSKEVENIQKEIEERFYKNDTTIASVRSVMEGKHLLVEDSIQKEIGRLEKMILQVARSRPDSHM